MPCALPYRHFAKPGVRLLRKSVRAIDPHSRRVTTDAGTHECDYLVVALVPTTILRQRRAWLMRKSSTRWTARLLLRPQADRHLPRARRGIARAQGTLRGEPQGALVRPLNFPGDRRLGRGKPAAIERPVLRSSKDSNGSRPCGYSVRRHFPGSSRPSRSSDTERSTRSFVRRDKQSKSFHTASVGGSSLLIRLRRLEAVVVIGQS